jgi:hypothetical protein
VSPNRRAWLLSIGFLLVGIGMLWWAHQQWLGWNQVLVERRVVPSTRVLLWLLTLVLAGFLFGMTASSARSSRERARPAILLTLSFIPFAILYYFWTQVTLGWFPQLPGVLVGFLYTETTLLAASLILGFFLSGLLGGVEQVHAPVVETPELPFGDDAVSDSDE